MRDTNDAKTDDAVQAGVSRRTLVRTAGHSLWAVPAITLATAAPAMAISGTATPTLSRNKKQITLTVNYTGVSAKSVELRREGATVYGPTLMTTNPFVTVFEDGNASPKSWTVIVSDDKAPTQSTAFPSV